MMELNNLLDLIKSPEVVTMLVGAIPIAEVRGAIPLAVIQFKFSLVKACFYAVIGNLIPIIPVLVFLNYFARWLMKFPVINRFFTWWFERTKRHSAVIEKYEALGLAIFVGIPLPMTGAWSGCVAAYLLQIKFRYAFPAIVAGVLMAAVIVAVLTVTAQHTIRLF